MLRNARHESQSDSRNDKNRKAFSLFYFFGLPQHFFKMLRNDEFLQFYARFCRFSQWQLWRFHSLLPSLRVSGANEAIHIKNKSARSATASRSASWCIKRGAKEAGVLPLFLCKKRNQARLSPKSVPKAYEHSEVKTAELFFRSAFASHQPLARCVGERGGVQPFLRKSAIM